MEEDENEVTTSSRRETKDFNKDLSDDGFEIEGDGDEDFNDQVDGDDDAEDENI